MGVRRRSVSLEFLGTGTSTGVPIAGCSCRVCRSTDRHDNRLRSSVLIRHGRRNLVIDTGPEFRLQCLRAGITSLDAVLLTHNHVDHVNGLDDVRPFSVFRRRTLPVWGNADTVADIRRRFEYIWEARQVGGGLPDIDLRSVTGPFTAAGLTVTPVPILHGALPILGYRIGDLAYLTDISALPESSLPLLRGLGTLILSCVRRRPHRTHLNVKGVMELHRLVQPKQTILTHLSHYYSHKDLIGMFPVAISPAHDGLVIPIRVEPTAGSKVGRRSDPDPTP